jgi:hypothetical protein
MESRRHLQHQQVTKSTGHPEAATSSNTPYMDSLEPVDSDHFDDLLRNCFSRKREKMRGETMIKDAHLNRCVCSLFN